MGGRNGTRRSMKQQKRSYCICSLSMSHIIISTGGCLPHSLHQWVFPTPSPIQVGVSQPTIPTGGCVPPISPTSGCVPPHHPYKWVCPIPSSPQVGVSHPITHTSEGPLLTAGWSGSHLKTSHSSPVWGERGAALSSP